MHSSYSFPIYYVFSTVELLLTALSYVANEQQMMFQTLSLVKRLLLTALSYVANEQQMMFQTLSLVKRLCTLHRTYTFILKFFKLCC
jgi:hypothetical protein